MPRATISAKHRRPPASTIAPFCRIVRLAGTRHGFVTPAQDLVRSDFSTLYQTGDDRLRGFL
jgi:hypothetical protein